MSLLVIPEQIFNDMQERVRVHRAVEVGGVLVGRVTGPVFRVTHSISVHTDRGLSPSRYVSRIRPIKAELAKALSEPQNRYLGEWHSHPYPLEPRPSTIDIRAMDLVIERRVRPFENAVLLLWGTVDGLLSPRAYLFSREARDALVFASIPVLAWRDGEENKRAR